MKFVLGRVGGWGDGQRESFYVDALAEEETARRFTRGLRICLASPDHWVKIQERKSQPMLLTESSVCRLRAGTVLVREVEHGLVYFSPSLIESIPAAVVGDVILTAEDIDGWEIVRDLL